MLAQPHNILINEKRRKNFEGRKEKAAMKPKVALIYNNTTLQPLCYNTEITLN